MLVALGVGACASTPIGKADLLTFLDPGVTTRQEVNEKLGEPDAKYEEGRIVTYWIGEENGGYYRRISIPYEKCLVLSFRSDGVLARLRLVNVRKE